MTCEFTNSNLASLKIKKTSLGGDGTFGFLTSITGTGATGSFVDFTLTTSTGMTMVTFSGLSPDNTYSVAENLATLDGFEFDEVECQSGNDAGTGFTGITVKAGDTIECIFTNSALASLEITKTSIGGDVTFGFLTAVTGTGVTNGFGDFTLTTFEGMTMITFKIGRASCRERV